MKSSFGASLVVVLYAVSVVCAQEVDVDALISSIDAKIAHVDAEGKAADTSAKRQAETAPRTAKDQAEVEVTVEGTGETKREARKAAFRAAVEKAVGVFVDAESLMANDELLKDRVNTISNADIADYKILNEGPAVSGLYRMRIKARVEKKAIAPKFADVFPTVFETVAEAAETIHVRKVSRTMRSADAAAMMTAAMDGVDRMQNWVRLSVVKGRGLEEVSKFKGYRRPDVGVKEVPDKGLYAVRYSLKIDEEAYLKGFLPSFKQKLEKMREGEIQESALSAHPAEVMYKPALSQTEDGHRLLMTGAGQYLLPNDLKPFSEDGFARIGHLYFVDPIAISGFPGTNFDRYSGNNDCNGRFMFDGAKGVAKINDRRTCNIWLVDKMNKGRTVVRCSAYKVPSAALRAYWKGLYGELDSEYVLGNARKLELKNGFEQVEISLLDGNGDEIAVRKESIPGLLLASGLDMNDVRMGVTDLWAKSNVFDSFFIRPMFVCHGQETVYSTEVQRDTYFALTDDDLSDVKQVKVRFVK